MTIDADTVGGRTGNQIAQDAIRQMRVVRQADLLKMTLRREPLEGSVCLAAATLFMIIASGCAGTIVRPSDLPPSPRHTASGVRGAILVLDQASAPMAEEVRQYVSGLAEVREATLAPEADLRGACPRDGFLVLRPRMGRTHFASNAGDRNALMIYESAIVVGLPVALISAVAWPWYGETTMEGTLEAQRCRPEAPLRRTASSFRLRSEGRGFIRGGTIQEAQAAAAARAVTRKLLTTLEADMPSEGGAR